MAKTNSNHCCPDMESHLADKRVAICYIPEFREYSIKLYDKVGILCAPRFEEYDIVLHECAESLQRMVFCPWCGNRLPESLRDQWFQHLWQMGLDVDAVNIPEQKGTFYFFS